MLLHYLEPLIVLLIASITLTEGRCVEVPVQEIYDISDTAHTNVIVSNDGFRAYKDGQCFEAKYADMPTAQQLIYDDIFLRTRDDRDLQERDSQESNSQD
ncbi:hypothetical protein PV08_08621 [Exophiala spinifera]|uniref:Uncharacterized protein n=1 Tax=Exophiala spinifera TaxID=91928 RepID=A0A0D2B3G7_9EURO|nr:uncharacterized protein PV08_08621 [Exophiala spinifera]KIW13433.1 hypothetical protein PV08_08621 [Exophiala spinifera]